ncbi:hypothetical protein HQ393_08010 [Chitinibacter bivalviorum]|uniref:Uncharacterized protein n=1 Tax=Chitinibacter bivalviorum TaxID=2739434 RepID=A0A7H9BHT9_9NEIS|nr:hypothetical protein [Chitinibacter bivalviorum]QLG88197.1 hypothetical protein HQ393_08010 [Chitinibacter bivalviorum]
MKTLQLDFNRRPSVVPWLGLILTVLGVVAVLWVMTQMDVAKENKAQIEIREDDVALRLKQLEAKRLAAQKASPVSDKVAKVTRAQTNNIETGLLILEDAWRPEIAITRMEIANSERDIKLEIEAKTLNDVLLLVDRLNQDPAVKQVSLARNAIKVGDPFRPAVASLEIFWQDNRPIETVASQVEASKAGVSR